MVEVDRLRLTRLAAVGLGTSTGQPEMIVEAAVYQLTGGLITAGPFMYWAGPDVPLHQIPARCWPNLRFAPPWAEVADRLVKTISGRTVVMHEPDRLAVLRQHLPDWQPAAVAFTRELTEQTWPGLDDYRLDTLIPRFTDHQLTRVGPSATAEAQAVALLVGSLLLPQAATRRTGSGPDR